MLLFSILFRWLSLLLRTSSYERIRLTYLPVIHCIHFTWFKEEERIIWKERKRQYVIAKAVDLSIWLRQIWKLWCSWNQDTNNVIAKESMDKGPAANDNNVHILFALMQINNVHNCVIVISRRWNSYASIASKWLDNRVKNNRGLNKMEIPTRNAVGWVYYTRVKKDPTWNFHLKQKRWPAFCKWKIEMESYHDSHAYS